MVVIRKGIFKMNTVKRLAIKANVLNVCTHLCHGSECTSTVCTT